MELLTSPPRPKFFSPRILIPDPARTAHAPGCRGHGGRGLQQVTCGGPLPTTAPCLACVLQYWAWRMPTPLHPSQSLSGASDSPGGQDVSTATPAPARGGRAAPPPPAARGALPCADSMAPAWSLPSPSLQDQTYPLDFRIATSRRSPTSPSGLVSDADPACTASEQTTHADGRRLSRGAGCRGCSPDPFLAHSTAAWHEGVMASPEEAMDLRMRGESLCKSEPIWAPCSPCPRASLPRRPAQADSSDPWSATREAKRQDRKPGCARSKNFRCPHCVISCSNRGQLVGHLRIHTGERPFVCGAVDCGKAFVRKEELTRHRRLHTGERPYRCPRCVKAFTRKDHLNKHARVHASPP